MAMAPAHVRAAPQAGRRSRRLMGENRDLPTLDMRRLKTHGGWGKMGRAEPQVSRAALLQLS